MTHRDMDTICDDYLNHLIPDEARVIIAPSDKSVVHGYIQWYFRVSHPYITADDLRDPHRITHRATLEDDRAMVDHVVMCCLYVIISWRLGRRV